MPFCDHKLLQIVAKRTSGDLRFPDATDLTQVDLPDFDKTPEPLVSDQTPTSTRPNAAESLRGVPDGDAAREWLHARNIEDIECIVPDLAGVARGKMMPVEKFFSGPVMTMPASIFAQTISGDYPDDDERFPAQSDRR